MEGRLQNGDWWNRCRMKTVFLLGALVVAAHAQPVMAQQESRELVPTASKRAINLARGTATKSNGGLRLYHPARCMYGNPTNNPCLTKRDANGFEFQFLGGPPGWEVLGLPPTVDSIVLIAPNGRSVVAESHEDISEVSSPPLP